MATPMVAIVRAYEARCGMISDVLGAVFGKKEPDTKHAMTPAAFDAMFDGPWS